jgi:hypothetical protein
MAYCVNGCWTVLSNVGIGTDDLATYHPAFMSPSLNIVGSRPGINLENTSGTLNTIRLRGTGASGEMHLNFNGVSCTNGSLSFYAYGCTNRSVLTLGLNGNVGIGIDAPFSPHNGNGLIVRGNGGDTRGIIELHDGGASGGKSVLQQVGGDTYLGQLAKGTGNGDVYILTGGSGASATISMVVKCAGNVGIGTTSPSERLHIASSDAVIEIRMQNTCISSYIRNQSDNLNFYVKDSEKLRITCIGNVGIGTTSPATTLHICDANALGRDDMIRLTQGNINNHAYIRSERCNGAMILMGATRNSFDGCIASDSGIFWSFCNNPIIIGTCNRERVRFASNGSVGIGITSPSYQLHVNGTFYAAGSSQDYKEDICQYNTDSCLFMCLKPKAYQYKEEWKHLGKDLKSGTQIGLIAEEVAESHPELAVLVNEEDNQVVRNVDYEKLSIILLAEVQKLRQEVDQLNQK